MRTIPEVKITGDKEVAEFPRVRTVKSVRFSNLDFLGFGCGVSAEALKTSREMHKGFNESVTFLAIGGWWRTGVGIIREVVVIIVIIRVTRIGITIGAVGAAVVITWITVRFLRHVLLEGVVGVDIV